LNRRPAPLILRWGCASKSASSRSSCACRATAGATATPQASRRGRKVQGLPLRRPSRNAERADPARVQAIAVPRRDLASEDRRGREEALDLWSGCTPTMRSSKPRGNARRRRSSPHSRPCGREWRAVSQRCSSRTASPSRPLPVLMAVESQQPPRHGRLVTKAVRPSVKPAT
jgi:hypothetical protein